MKSSHAIRLYNCGHCGTSNEDDKHFLLHCPLFNTTRATLLGEISEVLNMNISVVDDDFL